MVFFIRRKIFSTVCVCVRAQRVAHFSSFTSLVYFLVQIYTKNAALQVWCFSCCFFCPCFSFFVIQDAETHTKMRPFNSYENSIAEGQPVGNLKSKWKFFCIDLCKRQTKTKKTTTTKKHRLQTHKMCWVWVFFSDMFKQKKNTPRGVCAWIVCINSNSVLFAYESKQECKNNEVKYKMTYCLKAENIANFNVYTDTHTSESSFIVVCYIFFFLSFRCYKNINKSTA